MYAIAVIDDRQDMRTTISRLIRVELDELDSDWIVIDSDPLPELSDYASWLNENDVCVLVLDEKLSENIANVTAVSYSGHEVASLLRKQRPDFPLIIITSVVDEDNLTPLNEISAELDAMFKRDKFRDDTNVHVSRMIRMGQRYLDRYEDELSDVDSISQKIALGNANDDDIKHLNAIREKTSFIVHTDTFTTMSEWVAAAQEIKEKLENLKSLIASDGASNSPGNQ